MNYNSIEIDEEYAYVNYRSRGGPYPMHAKRGTAVDKRKEKQWYNKNLTGMVLLEIDDPHAVAQSDGNNLFGENETPKKQVWIKAYNIIDYWDRFEQEREHLYGERLRREEERRKEIEERNRLLEENRRIANQRKLDLQNKIERGLRLPQGSVTINDQTIVIDRNVLEARFSEGVIEQ